MVEGQSRVAGRISAELSEIVRRGAPALAAVRVGAGCGASAFVWNPGLVVTSAAAVGDAGAGMPVALPGGRVILAERANIARGAGIAAFRTPPTDVTLLRADAEASVGAFVLALGAAADASPTARLALVHGAAPDGVRLDGSADPAAAGGPVFAMTGGLLGMALPAADGGWTLLPWRAIAQAVEAPAPAWLGVVLQPTAVPARLRAYTGQESAREVVRLAPGGPAEAAGLRVGDVLLTLDGFSLSGAGALRGIMTELQAGQEVAARVMRGGRIVTVLVTMGDDPAAR